MKINILLSIGIIVFYQACFTTNSPPEKETELLTLWKYDYDIQDAPNHPPLVVDDSLVFISGDSHLTSIRIHSGEEKWQVEDFGVFPLAGAILLKNQDQVVANHKSEIISWNINNGDREWTLPIKSPLTLFEIAQHVIFDNGYAFVGTGNQLYTVSMNGEVKYEKKLGMGTAHIASDGNTLFVGQGRTVTGALTLGRITALNAQNGDSLWAFDTDQGGFLWAAPIVENGVIYAGTYLGNPSRVFALNTETGEKLWERSGFSTFKIHSNQSKIYINASGWLYAINKIDGSIAWSVTFEGSGFGNIVDMHGYVYHARSNEIVVVENATGKVIHREPVPDGGGFFWHVAASSDKVFAQTSRQLIAYQPWHLREE